MQCARSTSIRTSPVDIAFDSEQKTHHVSVTHNAKVRQIEFPRPLNPRAQSPQTWQRITTSPYELLLSNDAFIVEGCPQKAINITKKCPKRVYQLLADSRFSPGDFWPELFARLGLRGPRVLLIIRV